MMTSNINTTLKSSISYTNHIIEYLILQQTIPKNELDELRNMQDLVMNLYMYKLKNSIKTYRTCPLDNRLVLELIDLISNIVNSRSVLYIINSYTRFSKKVMKNDLIRFGLLSSEEMNILNFKKENGLFRIPSYIILLIPNGTKVIYKKIDDISFDIENLDMELIDGYSNYYMKEK